VKSGASGASHTGATHQLTADVPEHEPMVVNMVHQPTGRIRESTCMLCISDPFRQIFLLATSYSPTRVAHVNRPTAHSGNVASVKWIGVCPHPRESRCIICKSDPFQQSVRKLRQITQSVTGRGGEHINSPTQHMGSHIELPPRYCGCILCRSDPFQDDR
jgi:hypothetical protein